MKKKQLDSLDKLLTIQKVAQHLGLPVRTVLWQVTNNVIQGARKIGEGKRGIWLIPPDALENYAPPSKGRPPKKSSKKR